MWLRRIFIIFVCVNLLYGCNRQNILAFLEKYTKDITVEFHEFSPQPLVSSSNEHYVCAYSSKDIQTTITFTILNPQNFKIKPLLELINADGDKEVISSCKDSNVGDGKYQIEMTIPSNFLKANEANNKDKQKGTTISGVLYLSHYDDKGDKKIKDFSPYEFTFIVNSAPILQDSIAVIKTTNDTPTLGVAFNLPKEQLLYTLNDLDKFLITCKINDEEIGTATVPINDVNIDYDTTGNLVAKISS